MRTVCIIQARMGSNRLPGKVMKPLAGIPALWHVVDRVSRCTLIDEVVIATTTEPSDQQMAAAEATGEATASPAPGEQGALAVLMPREGTAASRILQQPEPEGLSDQEQPTKPVTYSVIKTGLIGLTRYLATYLADYSIRVNALSPGGVYTSQPEAFVQRLSELIPLGRMAREDEYKSAIVFLCSDASSFMTGQNIVMDGGRSVW